MLEYPYISVPLQTTTRSFKNTCSFSGYRHRVWKKEQGVPPPCEGAAPAKPGETRVRSLPLPDQGQKAADEAQTQDRQLSYPADSGLQLSHLLLFLLYQPLHSSYCAPRDMEANLSTLG